MDRLNLPFFYQLGGALKPLCDMKADSVDRFDFLIACLNVGGYVRTLFSTYQGLTVCKESGDKLLTAIEKAIGEWRQYRDLPEEQRAQAKVVSDEQVVEVIAQATEFQTILTAELQTLASYHITEKGIYSTPRLIEQAVNHLSEAVRSELPPSAKEDLNQAGRCLAFDLPTASGFHTWRAVETVLLMYCQEFQAKRNGRDWGSYINALKTVDADPKTIAVLDQIRELHRNPTMHPEIVLSMDEAHSLFGIAPSAIVAMITDIRKHRKITALPLPAKRLKPGSSAP